MTLPTGTLYSIVFNADAFLRRKQDEIVADRKSAFLLRVISELIRWVVVPVYVVTSLTRGLLLVHPNPQDPLVFGKILKRIGNLLYYFVEQYLGTFWDALLLVSPYPTLQPPIPWLSMFSWIVLLYGLAGLSLTLRNISDRQYRRAARTEDKLETSYPLLMQIQAMQQSPANTVGDISGTENTVTQVNTIRNFFRDDKRESWVDKYVVAVVVGLVINVISKLIHAS